jgi:hypothetical protein
MSSWSLPGRVGEHEQGRHRETGEAELGPSCIFARTKCPQEHARGELGGTFQRYSREEGCALTFVK